MPQSSGVPKPPDPSTVTQWIGKKYGVGYGMPAGRFRNIDTESEKQRMQAASRPDWSYYQDMYGQGTHPEEILGATDLLGNNVDPNDFFDTMMSNGPFQAITYNDSAGTVTTDAASYFSDESTAYLEEEGFYSGKGYSYSNMGTAPNPSVISSVDKAPADITLAPTSSILPPRPRTVAAGYDGSRRCLTVIFRDGTFYNYYGVSGLEWGNFKRAISKGRFIKAYLDGKVRGTADMGGVPQAHQELLYKVARTAQVIQGGVQQGQSAASRRRATTQYYGSHNTAARSSRKNAARAARVFRGGAP
jgi:KTSC domain